MQFVNVVLVFGLVVAALAAPVANAGVEMYVSFVSMLTG
jgi:hypothetical protein